MKPKPTPTEQAEAEQEFYHRSAPIMDEEDAQRQALRYGSLKTMEFFLRGLRVLATYDGNRSLALDCFILAHGQGDMIGMHSAVEVAAKHLVKKQTATKLVVMFRECLGIKNMPGQRDEKGRDAMSEGRKKQLKTK